jgi:circadian clock protein KaiB
MTPSPNEDTIVFRLYIAGELPNSRRAIGNLEAFCRDCLTHAHRIEIVDVLESPQRALSDCIFLTPQLIVQQEGRQTIIVGDLTDREPLRRAADFASARP